MIETYKEGIEDLFNIKSTNIIANSNDELFAIAIESIFNHALFNVIWFIDNEYTMEKVFNRAIGDAMNRFLNSGGKLLIYVNKRYPDGIFEKYISRFSEYSDEQFKYCKTSGITCENKYIEFITWDDVGYRIKIEVGKSPALFCVNDPIYVNKLNNIFKER